MVAEADDVVASDLIKSNKTDVFQMKLTLVTTGTASCSQDQMCSKSGPLQGLLPGKGKHIEQILLSGFFKLEYRSRTHVATPSFGSIILKLNITGSSLQKTERSSVHLLPGGEDELGSVSQLHPLPPPPNICGLREHSF